MTVPCNLFDHYIKGTLVRVKFGGNVISKSRLHLMRAITAQYTLPIIKAIGQATLVLSLYRPELGKLQVGYWQWVTGLQKYTIMSVPLPLPESCFLPAVDSII